MSLVAFAGLLSCSSEKVNLTIDSAVWSAQLVAFGGDIHLALKGSTNGDTVTVIIHGDGINSEVPLTLDSQGNFNQDVIIAFQHFNSPLSVSAGTYSTTVTASIGSTKTATTLVSGDLIY